MAYSKAKLKISGDKAYSCFGPYWLRKLSDKYLPLRTLTYVKWVSCHESMVHPQVADRSPAMDGSCEYIE
jgi:hypothetical protein